MITVEECKWITHDVPSGAVISAIGPCIARQRVQWMCYSDRFGELDGYIN